MNWWSLALGISLVVWGALVIRKPRFYDYRFGRYFDFTGYEVLFGGFVIVVGVLFIWTTLKKTKGTG